MHSKTTSVVAALERRSGAVIIAVLMVTALLAIPMIFMEAEEQASQDPKGEVFDLQEDINDRFEAPFHTARFIVEARGGDILSQAPLWELYQNSQRLLEADAQGELAPDGLPSHDFQVIRVDRLTIRPVNLRKGRGTFLAKQSCDDFCGVAVRIQEAGNLLAEHGGLIQNRTIHRYGHMCPVSRQGAAVIGLIGRGVKDRQRYPQEAACETMGILVSPMAAKAKPVAEYAPRRFGQIGVPVGK